ncbi:hypothetical protein BGW36DRAFT_387366 [Talaromyces proteolyticus]|uniref:MARVEL domain-containing protein n=1 Tax=Talaromyces proteolyticus TaxID=1131652 RepID=A0AAD4KP27_9EURO|nr:uncharacterized protein BGW36DRAFT_387366 [Talaromyces proteolyticus]KAH8692315.1 hypothetical protein BGW36DRAFT_387366 [Talaromyces proteolyticus]
MVVDHGSLLFNCPNLSACISSAPLVLFSSLPASTRSRSHPDSSSSFVHIIISHHRVYRSSTPHPQQIHNTTIMGVGSVALRIFGNGIRILQFLASAVILGIFSYYLAVLKDHHLPIATWIRAVEGMSGAATLYALLGSLFTLCLAGITFFGFIAMVLDFCFVGCMVAIAVLTRDGTQTCSGNVHTPLGNGPTDSQATGYGDNGFGFGSGETVTYLPNLRLACRLEKTAFALSIIAAGLFVISFFIQIPMARSHRREKRFGPSPSNGYTYGSTRGRFWRRNKNINHDATANTLPGHPTPGEVENGYKPEL